MARPKISPPPLPEGTPIHPRAQKIIDAIQALVAGTDDGPFLTAAERGLAAHAINHAAAVQFMVALVAEKHELHPTPEGDKEPSFVELGRRHGMASSSVQWRVHVHEGKVAKRWSAGVRTSR